MRYAVVMALALFVSVGLSAQTLPTKKSELSWLEPAKALIPYEKKLRALESDLIDLMDKLDTNDLFTCFKLSRDIRETQQRIKTSLIIDILYLEGTEAGAKFAGADIMLNYHETLFFLTEGAKSTKKSLAVVKNPLLAQLGLEGVRMMESSAVEVEKLHKAVNGPNLPW